MANAYGWVITRSTLDDNAAGVIGPRGCTYTAEQIKAEGVEFKLFDDDGELYYTGFYLGPDDEQMFAPLVDYGMPNAGATEIQYRNQASGLWETL